MAGKGQLALFSALVATNACQLIPFVKRGTGDAHPPDSAWLPKSLLPDQETPPYPTPPPAPHPRVRLALQVNRRLTIDLS